MNGLKGVMVAKFIVGFIIIQILSAAAYGSDAGKNGAGTTGASSKKDTNADKNLRTYRLWIMSNILPLENTAIEKGIDASPDEMTARFNIMCKLLTNSIIDRRFIQSEIIVQKYLENSYGQTYIESDLQKACDEVKTLFGVKNITVQDIEPHLKLRVLLSREDVQHEISALNARNQKESFAALVEAKKPWFSSELTIDAPDNEWVARSSGETPCTLTVKQFNDNIIYHKIPRTYPLDTARHIGIRSIMSEIFIYKKAVENGFMKSDSFTGQIKKWYSTNKKLEMMNEFFEIVSDENSLWDAYGYFYKPLFKMKKLAFFSIIGSSDSFFIDSIAECAKKPVYKKEKNGDGKKGDHRIPWKQVFMTDVPPELLKVSDTLKKGAISNIVTTGYGYFIIRVDSIVIKHEVPFESVKDTLIYLASRRKSQNYDSILYEKAFSVYHRNKYLSMTPDTFRLISSFYPEYTIKNHVSKSNKNEHVRPEEQKYSKNQKTILSTSLPRILQYQIMDKFSDERKKDTFSDTVNSIYGVFRFTVLEKKNGGKTIPFSLVKNRLIDSIIVRDIDSVFDCSLYSDSSFTNVAIARMYLPFFLGIDDGFRDTLMKQLKKTSNKQGTIPKELLHQYTNERRNEIDHWLTSVEINSNVIRSEK